MKRLPASLMSALHTNDFNRSLTSLCLLASAAMPIIYFGTQIVAAPFFPGYSFSLHSVSMLGTRFSRHPAIFNAGEMLTGFAALGGALGLYRSFRRKTHVLFSWLIGFSVACTGVMCLKAGLFPMPDPRHSSWEVLQNFTIIIPHLMLIGLWKQSHSLSLRIYLIFSVTFLFLLTQLISYRSSISWLESGTIQRLTNVATLVPVGVVGFFFWREPQRESSDHP